MDPFADVSAPPPAPTAAGTCTSAPSRSSEQLRARLQALDSPSDNYRAWRTALGKSICRRLNLAVDVSTAVRAMQAKAKFQDSDFAEDMIRLDNMSQLTAAYLLQALDGVDYEHLLKETDKGRVWNEKEGKASKMSKCRWLVGHTRTGAQAHLNPRPTPIFSYCGAEIICRSKAMKKTERELPITADRDAGEEDLVGVAAQGFLMNPMSSVIPGWISGYVTLPPRAIKDAEGVGYCSQVRQPNLPATRTCNHHFPPLSHAKVFFVAECQANSFEVAIAMPQDQQIVFEPESAQRFLLSPGDQFFVAPGNVYRLQNHSQTEDCKLFWTIIKVPRPPPSLLGPSTHPCA